MGWSERFVENIDWVEFSRVVPRIEGLVNLLFLIPVDATTATATSSTDDKKEYVLV